MFLFHSCSQRHTYITQLNASIDKNKRVFHTMNLNTTSVDEQDKQFYLLPRGMHFNRIKSCHQMHRYTGETAVPWRDCLTWEYKAPIAAFCAKFRLNCNLQQDPMKGGSTMSINNRRKRTNIVDVVQKRTAGLWTRRNIPSYHRSFSKWVSVGLLQTFMERQYFLN